MVSYHNTENILINNPNSENKNQVEDHDKVFKPHGM